MILKSKKGRAKVLGSKSSRNSYFSRSRLILRLSALRHLIFIAIWWIFQKLCWNLSILIFLWLSRLLLYIFEFFCSVSRMYMLWCRFLCLDCVVKLDLLQWWSCVGFQNASRTEKRQGCHFWLACKTKAWHDFLLDFQQKFCHVQFVTAVCFGFASFCVTANGLPSQPYRAPTCSDNNWHAKRGCFESSEHEKKLSWYSALQDPEIFLKIYHDHRFKPQTQFAAKNGTTSKATYRKS